MALRKQTEQEKLEYLDSELALADADLDNCDVEGALSRLLKIQTEGFSSDFLFIRLANIYVIKQEFETAKVFISKAYSLDKRG